VPSVSRISISLGLFLLTTSLVVSMSDTQTASAQKGVGYAICKSELPCSGTNPYGCTYNEGTFYNCVTDSPPHACTDLIEDEYLCKGYNYFKQKPCEQYVLGCRKE
jgi:hypothetical protein